MAARHLYLIAIPVILACASAGGGSGTPTVSRRTTLLAEEMVASNADVGTAYDALSRLRPSWLTRATTSFDPPATELPVVFVDGRRYGELESLRGIDANHIAEIHFYSAAEAGKFGMQGGLSGVIEITMKKK